MITHDSQFAIETFSLTKIFPDLWGRAKVIAVNELDLKIRHNEVYGLLGPNGSGKTTTLKMLLSLLHPTKGKVLMLGGDSTAQKIKDRIGYLPEESYLYRFLNARETLDFYGKLFGLPADVRKSRIEALLEMVGLSGMANRPVGTYSKGMARRIGLAQALINDPDLLILDEPTSGMDPLGTRQMKDLIVELAKRGKTILLCSHLLADVEDVCDRIGILYGGTMQAEGLVGDLLKHTNQQQFTTAKLSESTVQKIKEMIEQENGKCEISHPMDKLEEYFIRTVTAAQQQQLPTSGAKSGTNVETYLEKMSSTSDVLDRLVTKKLDEEISTKEVETVEPVKSTDPQDKSDSILLDSLTQKEVDKKSPATEHTEKPAQEQPEKTPEPDQDVLKRLMGDESSPDVLTERTKPEQEGDHDG